MEETSGSATDSSLIERGEEGKTREREMSSV